MKTLKDFGLRIIKPIEVLDEKGRCVYYKTERGCEGWREFDERGNVIHEKYSSGEERWREFDERGNVIYQKHSNGIEYWQEFDEKDFVKHYRDSEGLEWWLEWNEEDRISHFKNNQGKEHWQFYSENGLEIHFKDNEGFEYWIKRREDGRRYEDNRGLIKEEDYYGNVIYRKDNVIEWWREYDEKGCVLHYKDNKGVEYWFIKEGRLELKDGIYSLEDYILEKEN